MSANIWFLIFWWDAIWLVVGLNLWFPKAMDKFYRTRLMRLAAWPTVTLGAKIDRLIARVNRGRA